MGNNTDKAAYGSPGKQAFDIVFNDEYIIVLNKVAKLLVHPSPKKEKYTLTSLLKDKIKAAVYPCHRLDRETTGLIIYARDKGMQRKLMDEFRKGLVKKKYIAFVKGRMKKARGSLSGYILDADGVRFREKPKMARANYHVLKAFRHFSVIELTPLTGRTNQLRIQLAKHGNPILGERRYAFRRDFKVDFKRLALHACFLSFIHPVSKQRVDLETDLAQDMREFLKKLIAH
ncbi:MAG: hypothetical protein B1H08_03315 [Candidatus Omnitrophica bacterium 4484_171]|nr:MAG: hypothetical protein B1H08_03315 [Candidatus Omnitrophica bacterium 4484_171]